MEVRRHGRRQAPGHVGRRRRRSRLDVRLGGRAQFAAILQRGDDADNAIEADNNEFNNNVLPRSHPQIYNVTICGDPLDRSEVQRGATCVAARRSRSATS